MEKEIYDCIVVGGGISGVSFANYISQKEHSVLILEKEPKLGGRIHSIAFKEDPSFWYELGAHTCYNSYTELINLIEEGGNKDKIVPIGSLSYKLYSQKKIRGVFSELSIFPLIFRCWRYFFSKKTGKTTQEYFEPIVGKSNYEKLFSKMFRAVISQPADEYPAEIFLKKRDTKDESVSRRFSYQGGLSKMVEDIAAASQAEVKTSVQVTNVEKLEDGTFCVTTSREAKFYSKKLVLATDISPISDFLAQLQLSESSSATKAIQPSESIAVNLSTEKDKLDLKPIAGIIPLSNQFFSAVSRDGIENEQWRSFTFHFPESKISPAERLETIFRVLNIRDEQSSHTQIYRHTLPAVRLTDLGLNEKLEKELKGTGIYVLGNYFQGMSLEDCVRHSKVQAEKF